MKRSAQKNGPSKAVVCLKFLEKYCNDLLSCDERVSQCSLVTQFFHPKDQDLKPEYAQNRYVVSFVLGNILNITRSQSRYSIKDITHSFTRQVIACPVMFWRFKGSILCLQQMP